MARIAATPVSRGARAELVAQLHLRASRQRPKTIDRKTGGVFVSPWPALQRRAEAGAQIELPAWFFPRDRWPRRTGPSDRLRLTTEDRIEHV